MKSGLVKKQVLLCGYLSPMEMAVNEMHAEMKRADETAVRLRLDFRPKAIYVSNTNIVDGSTPKEDSARPFKERLARPILIWRHLVEHSGVDPAEIAVYCELRVDPKFPLPLTFKLFSGGESDYDEFISV